MNTIVFKLADKEIKFIADCVLGHTDEIKDFCPGRPSGQIYVIPAAKTPYGISARIEILLRRSVIDREIRIYSHLNIDNEKHYSLAKLLTPADLDGDMLKEVRPSDNLPYHVIFERSDQ